jgi:hypothetical protein
MSAVFGAPIVSSASATNAVVSAVPLRKYCENPPLLTSDSTALKLENTF